MAACLVVYNIAVVFTAAACPGCLPLTKDFNLFCRFKLPLVECFVEWFLMSVITRNALSYLCINILVLINMCKKLFANKRRAL